MEEKGKEKKVKGAITISLALIINARKDIDWQKEAGLTDQELRLIKKGILASAWYDQELWEKMTLGVWKLVGKGTPEGAYQFGYGLVAKTLLNIYHGALAKDDPAAILARLASLYNRTFFTSGTAEFEPTKEGGIFRISHPEGIPGQECYVAFIRGFLAKIVQENKGEKVRVECPEEALVNSQKLSSLTYQIYWAKK